MSQTLYWMQSGGCGGDSMALLNIDTPELPDLCRALDIELVWHPSFSNISAPDHLRLIDNLKNGNQRLDILCVEGFVINGPNGSGRFDLFWNRPKRDLLLELAAQARYIVAVGTCAAFGGVGNIGPIEASGLQFVAAEKGGLLGKDFVSTGGYPVINLPGCPAHPAVVADLLTNLVDGDPLELNELHAPRQWFDMLVHQGCLRNEYHEYRVEEHQFGERGCLFFHRGCRGPLTSGPCNKLQWNRRSSKTNVGVPCVGCTSPEFPQPYPFFETRNIADVPLELPAGVDRAHYLAYKGMAAAAAPERLKKRKNFL
jgi:uptake hydrogenase small subunit